MKVVINKCYGGFSVSPEAALWMYEQGWTDLGTPILQYYGLDKTPKNEREKKYRKFQEEAMNRDLGEWRNYLANTKKGSLFVLPMTKDEQIVVTTRPDDRTHPLLIKAIEKFGDKANGACAELSIVEIPDGIEYEIEEYDGVEWISESHRRWS